MSVKHNKRFIKKFSWFWILTIAYALFFCFGLIIVYFNTGSGHFVSGFLYPIASNFSDLKFIEKFIDSGLLLYTLFTLLFPLILFISLGYYIFKAVIDQKIFHKAGIPLLLSVIIVSSAYIIRDHPIYIPKSEIKFDKTARQTEIYVPELEYKGIVPVPYYENYKLIHYKEIEETKTFQEVTLPKKYQNLSLTGKFYYRKYNGQVEVYFPINEYKNGYEKGYLWISGYKVPTFENIFTVFDLRYGWYETFGKKVTDGSKLL